MRFAIAQPCLGSSETVLRTSRSSVPWTRSLGLPIRSIPRRRTLADQFQIVKVSAGEASRCCVSTRPRPTIGGGSPARAGWRGLDVFGGNRTMSNPDGAWIFLSHSTKDWDEVRWVRNLLEEK